MTHAIYETVTMSGTPYVRARLRVPVLDRVPAGHRSAKALATTKVETIDFTKGAAK